ncbi:MAG: TetR/AcrR family transcriptional regulator [Oscillospiraceae bacterium]|nr:TetR/AcrR family transcriptional regulator [Oscillospiraceae bacterium]
MAETVKNSADAEKRSDKIQDGLSEQIVQIVARLAAEEGAHKVTAKQVINELGMTNRVFYNRFSNIDEVLRIVYRNAVVQMHENIEPDFHDKDSFLRFCTDVAVKVMMQTYDVKMQFRCYVFEHDSLTENNRLWWADKVKKYYAIALEQGFAREVDTDALCYAIWCFCRGYYADALSRQLPKDEAVRYFTFGFACLLNGVVK